MKIFKTILNMAIMLIKKQELDFFKVKLIFK